ncbi:MAG: hypothetical protein OXK17_08375 [Thaumarchaeota archaeon]|nr:hypothetical protein [Nitrososphaerota archaeon]
MTPAAAPSLSSSTVLYMAPGRRRAHAMVRKIVDAAASVSKTGACIPRGKLPVCWACGSKLSVFTRDCEYHAECEDCTWWVVLVTRREGLFDVKFSQTFYDVQAGGRQAKEKPKAVGTKRKKEGGGSR